VVVRILEDAEAEILQARVYLEQQVPGLGGRFIDDLEITLAVIGCQPLIFPLLETLPDSSPYRRALLTVFRYAIIFEIAGEEILVVAVSHTSRRPNYWLGRRN